MGEPIRFDFGTGSDPDRNAPNSGPRHWNAYVEAVDDAKMALPIHADDGFVAFSASTSLGNIRALPVVVGNFIYALLGSSVVRVDASGNRLDVGGVSGTDRAIMARNDKSSTPQVVITLDGGLRFVVENDVVSSLSDVDLPAPNSCTFLNRKIVFGIPDGRFFWSSTDEATDINSLDFAEAEGNPDGCVRVIAHLQELWIFGTESVEVWYDDGTSFVRRGSTVIPKGCISKHTIAELDMDLFWVGNDNVVYAARGYGFERISTHYVEKLIRETSDKNTIIGWTYFRDGSAFYVLSGPDWTWRFNRTLSRKVGKPVWTDRESYNNGGRWLAEYAVQLNNEWIIGSNSNDALYRLSAAAFDEAGTYLVWKIRSAPLHAYPKQICIDRLHLDFVTGVGMTSGTFGVDGVDDYTKVILHFDDDDESTTIIDSHTGGTAHVWTAAGDAQIDTAQSKFGGSSCLFDGTGDWVTVSDNADFALGSGDWTVDLWFYCDAASGTIKHIAGQNDSSETATTKSFHIQRTAADTIRAQAAVGSTVTSVTTTSTFTNSINTGWHHLAFVRTGDTLLLFIDGTQEDSDTISGTVNDSSNALRVGAGGEVTGNPWIGWIDEFRLSVGIARWTSDFTPPVGPYKTSGEMEHLTDPQVGLRWSDDGGRTWSNQIFRSLGAVGQYGTRVTFDGLGITGRAGRILELEISSPVVRSLMYAAIEGDPAMV